MNKNDKEWIIKQLRSAIEEQERRALSEKDDSSPDASKIRGRIDGLMDAINIVRGS